MEAYQLLDKSAAFINTTIAPLEHDDRTYTDIVTLTKEQVKHEQIMAAFHGGFAYADVFDLKPGKYARLVVDGKTMMSTTQMELRTNTEFVRAAHGRVLVAGLGLGLILKAIEQKPEVKSIMVLEKYASVIKVVKDRLKLGPKVTVLLADAHWPLAFEKGTLFETIYFDIWPGVCGDNWEEMKRLKAWYRKWLNKEDENRWMGAWREDAVRSLARGR